MTCIVGLETKKGVLMGCDSMAASGWDMRVTTLKKIFIRENFLIGYTTSFRMGQLLQYRLIVESQQSTQSDLEYLSTTFIDAVRDCFSVGGFTKVENQQEEGGQFLVGYRGKLYVVEGGFQVNRSIDSFNTVGCSSSYALASLFNTKSLSPKKRVKQALKTADYFSNGVCGPFHYLKMSKT